MCGFGGNLSAAHLMLIIMTIFLANPNFQVHCWYLCSLEELDVLYPFCPSCATKIRQLMDKPGELSVQEELESVLIWSQLCYKEPDFPKPGKAREQQVLQEVTSSHSGITKIITDNICRKFILREQAQGFYGTL